MMVLKALLLLFLRSHDGREKDIRITHTDDYSRSRGGSHTTGGGGYLRYFGAGISQHKPKGSIKLLATFPKLSKSMPADWRLAIGDWRKSLFLRFAHFTTSPGFWSNLLERNL
jgi:hypothetical protein